MTDHPIRLIPRLDVKGPNVVKGIHLEGLRVVGTPDALARRYYEDGADEILYMDVVASLYGRNSILSVVAEAAREIFVPLTVGGGMRTVDDITAALRAGADKVAINTAAIARPGFLNEAAARFGSQCIVLSVEAKARDGGQWEALTDNGREQTGRDVLDWAAEAEQRGAGEILITSIDREGTRRGLARDLIAAVRARVSVPVIACGGVADADDIAETVRDSGCDAVCCASVLHYDTLPLPAMKAALAERGIAARP